MSVRDHRHFVECASTNDVARDWSRNAVDAAPDGAIVTADFQTAGRGRRGRVWQSVAGENALMSVVLRPPYGVAEAWKLGFVAALAVSDVVLELGASAALKWPNDVLIEGRKVSGILVEAVSLPAGEWAAIVGVGVNVNQASFNDEVAFDVRPISLLMALGHDVEVDGVRAMCRRQLMEREEQHREDGFASIASAWRERMAPGFEIKRGASRGIQTELLDSGEIEVRLPDGTFARWGTVDV